jgi:hypothetical protein
MSIYDTVKAEIGDGPSYAARSDYTKYFGYAGGKSLGQFDSIADANKAGAKSTEKTFDEEGYRAADKAYRDHQGAIQTEWYNRVRAEYPEVNDAVFSAAYSLAYDRGHSSGYGEVELYISDYVEFAVKVIEASK